MNMANKKDGEDVFHAFHNEAQKGVNHGIFNL
jgi:hypothetical protein